MATSGRKDDQEKPDMDLLSPYALEKIAQVMTFGKKKYGANNWRGGITYSRLLAAVSRHINSYRKGETFDPETSLSHLAHASCGLMMLLEFETTRKDLDDRYFVNQVPVKGPRLEDIEKTYEEAIDPEDKISLISNLSEAKKEYYQDKRPFKTKFTAGDIVKHVNNDTEVIVEGTYWDAKGNPVLFVKDSNNQIFGVDPNFYKSIYVEKETK